MDDINQSLGAIYKWQSNIDNNKKKKNKKIRPWKSSGRRTTTKKKRVVSAEATPSIAAYNPFLSLSLSHSHIERTDTKSQKLLYVSYVIPKRLSTLFCSSLKS